jgi:DNA-binding transcriptional LysR family regulator
MKIPRISLEQWAAFIAVIDKGSFAAAAEALNKSQSSVSYAVNRINSGLPSPVLKLSGRKAVLTDEGEVLYRYANQLLKQAQETESVAHSMAMGFESEVTIALDALLDISGITCLLEKFSQAFPHTRIRVLETSLSGTTEALLEKKADLVIGPSVPVGYLGTPLFEIVMIPVAASNHPLVNDGHEVEEWELKSYRQIVLRDTGNRRQIDGGWLEAEQRWTVSHFSSSVKLVLSGVGFAFLPYNWIAAEIETGTLRQIRLSHGLGRKVQLYSIVPERGAAGPATRALANFLEQEDWKKLCQGRSISTSDAVTKV